MGILSGRNIRIRRQWRQRYSLFLTSMRYNGTLERDLPWSNEVEQAPEFQLVPLPDSNPILEGTRWKQYHYSLGESLKDIPQESWDIVCKEKSSDMIVVLDFPYNGEPPRVTWL